MNLSQTQNTKAARMSQADQLLISIILKNTKVTQAQVDEALADCVTAKQEGRELDLAAEAFEQSASFGVRPWIPTTNLARVNADERLWALSQRLDRPTHALGAAEGLDPRAAEAVQLAFDEASALTEAVLRWLGAD